MLKSTPKRGSLFVLAAMAACALVAPATASAANWAVVGTTHVLDSSTFSFLAGGALNAGAACSSARFHADVRSGAVLTITSASFSGCTGTAGTSTCSVIMIATKLPWSATAIASNNLAIDGVHVGASFSNKPGTSCPLPTTATVTGSISGSAPGTSTWDFFAHALTFNNAPGLTAHIGAAIGSFPATATAALRDTTQTLTIT